MNLISKESMKLVKKSKMSNIDLMRVGHEIVFLLLRKLGRQLVGRGKAG